MEEDFIDDNQPFKEEKIPFVPKKELNESVDEMDIASRTIERSTNPESHSVIPYIYDNNDMLDLFELNLRGYYIDRRNNQLIKVKKQLANEKGINDIMGELRLLTNKQNSFAIREKQEILMGLEINEEGWIERYIFDKTADEFGIRPEDGFKITNDMYNIVFSAWSQGLQGASLRFIRDSTRISESNQGGQRNERKGGFISSLFKRG